MTSHLWSSKDSDLGDYEHLISTPEELDIEDVVVKEVHGGFSWLDYSAFFAVGLSMMWTWYFQLLTCSCATRTNIQNRSAILQAVPYFKRRFKSSEFILRYFQASNLVVFAVAILSITIALTNTRSRPSYPRRLKVALVTYVVVAVLLTASIFTDSQTSAVPYFLFIQLMVFCTAIANGLSQNSAFAFAAGFGRTEYVPAIMTGEALAALLPSVIGLLFNSESNMRTDLKQKYPRHSCSRRIISR